jgi:hypothetical protein
VCSSDLSLRLRFARLLVVARQEPVDLLLDHLAEVQSAACGVVWILPSLRSIPTLAGMRESNAEAAKREGSSTLLIRDFRRS